LADEYYSIISGSFKIVANLTAGNISIQNISNKFASFLQQICPPHIRVATSEKSGKGERFNN